MTRNIKNKIKIESVTTDVLIIGGGLAGLMASVEASQIAESVVMVSKGIPGRSGNTLISGNGMAAVVEEGFDGDSIQSHVEDTLNGGAYLNELQMVNRLAQEAPAAVAYLQQLGVPFFEENGGLLRKGAPGHTHRRFLTVDDSEVKTGTARGLALSLVLYNHAVRNKVRQIERVNIIRLIKTQHDERVIGAIGLDRREEKIWVFFASATVLACGGAGGLYAVTTNTSDVSGDGYAIAKLAGAELRNMEFVQFYPAFSVEKPRMCLPTSSFSDGAVLKNIHGDRFMFNYSLNGEMATRDVMARAIYQEIKQDRGTRRRGVYMDFSGMAPYTLEHKYASLHAVLKGRKVMEVCLAMHFMLGGVAVNEFGRTTICGLYAAGEVAGGLHGANRLAGNALSEAAVFGRIAGREAALEAKKAAMDGSAEALKSIQNTTIKDILPLCGLDGDDSEDETVFQILAYTKKRLRLIMEESVGVVREEIGMFSARNELFELKAELLRIKCSAYRVKLQYHELLLMLETALSIAEAATKRKESVGAHFLIKR